MALYTIGEVAELCHINPVTLRAWQRRYGLLKPQRTDGGHRLFSETDIARIHEIKRWIAKGIPVSKVKTLLNNESPEHLTGWYDHQETLLGILQSGNVARLRHWIAETDKETPTDTLVNQLYLPLRQRLKHSQSAMQIMLSMLDGALIGYISLRLASDNKRAGRDALLVGWNISDTTRLWLAAWVSLQQGWRISVLAHPLQILRPSLFNGQTLLVYCGDTPTPTQKNQFTIWQQAGYPIYSLS